MTDWKNGFPGDVTTVWLYIGEPTLILASRCHSAASSASGPIISTFGAMACGTSGASSVPVADA